MANTDLTKVDYADGSLAYNANMKMGALRKLFNASQTGDLTIMFEAYSKIVKSWPYDGDPAEIEAWDELDREEFMAFNEAIMGSLQELGEA